MAQWSAGKPHIFDLALPPLELEAGALVKPHFVRGWWWGPADDLPVLQSRARVIEDEAYIDQAWQPVIRSEDDLRELEQHHAISTEPRNLASWNDDIQTILMVHALTGDMRAGGPSGWWERVVAPGKALDPNRFRLLCFNLLGSCYGTSGPCDEIFPNRSQDSRFEGPLPVPKGNFDLPENLLPATITTWDQARSILMALDRLGIKKVHLATGGSLGGMIVLCLAALDPQRFERIVPIGAADKATSWIIGWNHVQRRALLLDPDFPDHPLRGLELARQIGMLTYRAEAGTELRQGREMAGVNPPGISWSSRAHYKVSTWLEHQGQKLISRFDSRAYLALLGAMDHHDLGRIPLFMSPSEMRRHSGASGVGKTSWGVSRIRAAAFCIGIDSDQLFFPKTIESFANQLLRQGAKAKSAMLETPFGHDAFLIEDEKMDKLLWQALEF